MKEYDAERGYAYLVYKDDNVNVEMKNASNVLKFQSCPVKYSTYSDKIA